MLPSYKLRTPEFASSFLLPRELPHRFYCAFQSPSDKQQNNQILRYSYREWFSLLTLYQCKLSFLVFHSCQITKILVTIHLLPLCFFILFFFNWKYFPLCFSHTWKGNLALSGEYGLQKISNGRNTILEYNCVQNRSIYRPHVANDSWHS